MISLAPGFWSYPAQVKKSFRIKYNRMLVIKREKILHKTTEERKEKCGIYFSSYIIHRFIWKGQNKLS